MSSSLPDSRQHTPSQAQSLQQLNLSGPPRPLEPWFERGVEAKQRKPSLVPNRLDPVAFLARWGLRSEVNVRRAVGINFNGTVLAA
jgi:hypothetical protein